MTTITIRLNEKDKKLFKKISDEKNKSLSDWARDILINSIEDEYDLELIKEYEKAAAKGLVKYYTADEVEKELGL
ncbi:Uncharacterised protein [Urinicoccus massiliensis]|uniref:Antitoxin n=1 Tax=Urinicoccus massiliensis TaxID=1723382 RepID=A0A8H2M636_9FIRM|nr:DUF6290 family protein [Urinicoccus massiliensis]VFB17192.1 Uncharacterised protein [Urinicoccus massiliensis]